MLLYDRVIGYDKLSATSEQEIIDAAIRLKADRVPADAALLWQHNMRISLSAGDKTFANDMVGETNGRPK
jgi:hypothetical protein